MLLKMFIKRAIQCMLILACSAVWFFVITPRFTAIPETFNYSAEIFSLDNFYSEELQKFTGEQISMTTFSYNVVDKESDVLRIRNEFDVRKQTGEPIFSVERFYGIDQKTRSHRKGFGDQDRSGYLFGPKNTTTQNFVYWHINYDTPATMQFVEEQELHGLTVYKFNARYHADQTDDLEHLPNVPEKRGVNLDIELDLWIEPATGYLVKYEDRTTAYYYDIQSKKRIEPWNTFSNRFTEASVEKHVRTASALKRQYFLYEYGITGALLVFAMFVLVWPSSYERRRIQKQLHSTDDYQSILIPALLVVFGMMLLAGMIFVVTRQIVNEHTQTKRVGIVYWDSSEYYQEIVDEYKKQLSAKGHDEDSLEYITLSAESDITTLQTQLSAVIEQGIDVLFSMTTPATLIAKQTTETVPIVFSVVTYPEESGIIDSVHESGNNTVGARNHVPFSRQFFHFMRLVPDTTRLAFVHRIGEPNSTIQLQEARETLRKQNIDIIDIAAVNAEDLSQQLEAASDIDALYGACDTLVQTSGESVLIAYSKAHQIPSFTCTRRGVENGFLMGTVADSLALAWVAANQTDLVLRGANPHWLKTEEAPRSSIVINPDVANTLGITIPDDLLINTIFVSTEIE